MLPPFDGSAEWLEPDGLGGFASGTVDGIRTRRYHAALQVSLSPPTDRVVLVNGFDVWLETPAGQVPLTSQRYIPDVVHPDGARRIVDFRPDPWPRWTFRLDDGTCVVHELLVPRDSPVALASWSIEGVPGAEPPAFARLLVRPLLSCRDAHSLHQTNSGFRFEADGDGELVCWHPYLGIPGVSVLSNAAYDHEPVWYHGFLYTGERERGLDFTEDLASPGAFRWDLRAGPARFVLSTDSCSVPLGGGAVEVFERIREEEEARRAALRSRLHRSAEAFLVRRGTGRTVLAGYPWSTDWGRDTFVSLRGLCLATDRLDEARQILLEWGEHTAEGMLPNFFADRHEAPEFGSVDSSLWFVIAVHDYLAAMPAAGRVVSAADVASLRGAVNSLLTSYVAGTRYGIEVTSDGLLAAGEPGLPLTWMDARIGDWAVTPRVGKAVEVQALWLNALRIASHQSPRWNELLARGLASFRDRFWNARGGYLYDVVDVDRRSGTVDALFRPNQILAVGGLPYPLLRGEMARRVVDRVEERLWTPLGLRTLASGEPGYAGYCGGNVRTQRAVSHQGTVWPWLLGPFVEAWVRVRGDTRAAREQARARFLAPILRHLDEAGVGHISELADGDPPHTPRGTPFQAWSLGEVLRLALVVLAEPAAADSAPHTDAMIPV
jgi:predicted glycogen debranching enzyme